MLLQISIKNFALIENITMDFGSGFNVLTGETGAGKSILIDAINYVLGSKFNKDLIRYGKEKTYVEAIFEVNNEKLKNILLEYNIDYEEVIILSRETFQNGRSIAKVNGKSLVLNNIKKISNCLIDIHGQHQNQGLLDSGTHINYLDSFGDDIFKNQILEFNKNFSEYKNIIHKIDNINGKYDEKDKIVDYLKFQINEINKANLKEDEEEKLTLSYQQQTNASEVSTMLKECNNLLFESLENQSIYDGLNLVIKKLKIIQKYYPKMDSILNDIEGFYYNLQDVSLSFNDMFNEISYDENELNSINERLYLIENLKKKYGFSVKDVIENGKRLEEQINEINNYNEILDEYIKEKTSYEESLFLNSKKLHEMRISIANILEDRINKELKYIGMEKSNFKVSILEKDEFFKNGCDKVEFLISTNPGEPLKPLGKIVSGGELSRIMLAIKTAFADKDEIPSIIFDEIDIGISGRVAQSVAEKMYSISKEHQVFCVTHLAQIAVFSDNHFLVEKNVVENETFTKVTKLKKDKKVEEIAKMIGGKSVTKITIDNANEMINMANRVKS